MSTVYKVKSSSEHKLGRFVIVTDTIETGGIESPYSYVKENDFVCVFPVLGDDVIYIRQYRYAVDSWKLEFPCGGLESGENPEDTALRELSEETGFHAEEIVSLGWLHAKAGSSTAKVYMYLARCRDSGRQELDPAEKIEVMKCSRHEFAGLVDDGTFDHAYGIIAWYRGAKILGWMQS